MLARVLKTLAVSNLASCLGNAHCKCVVVFTVAIDPHQISPGKKVYMNLLIHWHSAFSEREQTRT